MLWDRAQIRAALWRRHLIAGVDRNFFWALSLTSGVSSLALVMVADPLWIVVVLFVAITVLELVRRATQKDPMAMRVWWRWVREDPRYAPNGRFDQRVRGDRRGPA